MKVAAQLASVFNLDKCIGCSTCTVSCKNLWTNRRGAEYMWWNNVETKPGIGYPSEWENQQKYKGGWKVGGGGPQLRLGGKWWELLNLFFNPQQPTMADHYGPHPFTYTYEDLHTDQLLDQQPMARPKSLIDGEEDIALTWGSNWEDDAAGTYVTGRRDVNFAGISQEEMDALLSFQDIFMFYLPRICNHCLNPACVAACPSGANYKRGEDGIVLIDQERCRSWRYCVTGCPYKKVYYNWTSAKAEKCLLCYPRVENGAAPACFHSCVGRLRYLGVLLYDLDRVAAVANAPDAELVQAQRELILDPFDPAVVAEARASGIPEDWLLAAQRSPVYFMYKRWLIALPLHVEFRTLPNVFYVPPQSPVTTALRAQGVYTSAGEWLPKLSQFRIPFKYLANLLAVGSVGEVERALGRLIAVRQYSRGLHVDGAKDTKALDEAGLTEQDAIHMHRLLALAFLNERFVIPTGHREVGVKAYAERGFMGYPHLIGRE
jgi:nitrate reductase beta subunit